MQLVYGVCRLALLSAPSAVVPTADSLQVMSPLVVATLTAEQSNEIRQRPVFWAERRPVEAVVEIPEASKEQQTKLKDVKLLGVFGEGDSVGIIAQIKQKTQRIHSGETISGWTLASVGTNEAVFTSGKLQETLILLPGSPTQPDKAENKVKHKQKDKK